VTGRRSAREVVAFSDDVLALLRRPAFAFVATLLPDGSPHATETWIDTDGRHVLLNTVDGYQKHRNLQRDPRISLVVTSPDDPARHVLIRGEVVSMTTDGATEHIEQLSQRYLGTPYPKHHLGTRVLVTIAPTWVHESLERRDP
jgi:PPOX class probable F420-dependent enzyme